MLAHVVDGLIVVLLFALLGLGTALHLRLRRLRGEGGELQALVDALNRAVTGAEHALEDLKRAALDAGAGMVAERDRASRVVDDLRLLTERADREADRLSDLIGEARTRGGAGVAAARPAPRDREQLERTLRTLR